jgi:hypothetical protein
MEHSTVADREPAWQVSADGAGAAPMDHNKA